MDSEVKAILQLAAAMVGTTEILEDRQLLPSEVNTLAEELLQIRMAQDILSSRRDDLRKMAFEQMDAIAEDRLSAPDADTVIVRQVRGGKPYLDIEKVREYFPPEISQQIIGTVHTNRVIYHAGGGVEIGKTIEDFVDQEAVERLVDGGVIQHEDIRQCFSYTPIVSALTFEAMEWEEWNQWKTQD